MLTTTLTQPGWAAVAGPGTTGEDIGGSGLEGALFVERA